ncbi:MAG: 3-methyl-2-oxobutanoate hydroxymethyltransferase, partial [Nocardioides sp.]
MSETAAPYGTGPATPKAPAKRVRTHHLREMKERGEKFAMLTAYEQYAAQTFDEAGIPVLLVGDSASNNVFGNETSLPVTVDELLPLTRAVARSTKRAMVVGDLPFGSYQGSAEQAFHTAVRFMKEANAHAVKLEGGVEMVPQVEKLTSS